MHTGLGRTNYVAIKDNKKLEELRSKYGHGFAILSGYGDNEGKVAFSGHVSDHGLIPDWIEAIVDEGADTHTNDMPAEETYTLLCDLASCMADGEVMIYQWVSHDDLRSVGGGSLALDSDGITIASVNLEEIYHLAEERLGVDDVNKVSF